MRAAAAAAAVLLVALALVASPGFAVAQAIGGKSVLQYHNSATKAGFYVDSALAGVCCAAVQSCTLLLQHQTKPLHVSQCMDLRCSMKVVPFKHSNACQPGLCIAVIGMTMFWNTLAEVYLAKAFSALQV